MAASFKKLKISEKLPFFMIALTALALFSVTMLQGQLVKKNIEQSTQEFLAATGNAKKIQLENFLQSVENDITLMAQSDEAKNALRDFSAGWQALDAQNDNYLYSAAQAQYHPWLWEFIQKRNYSDAFLFDHEGNLVYSVSKQRDSATNLSDIVDKNTGLGRAFQSAQKNLQADFIAFEDFQPYGPANDAPTAFVARAIIENGQSIGVIAYQIAAAHFDAILDVSEDLGASGVVYLVPQDKFFRPDFQLGKKRALKREQRIELIKNAEGKDAYMAYAPIVFHGTNWVLATEIGYEQVLAPFKVMQNFSVVLSLCVLFIIALIGSLYSKTLTNSVRRLADAIKKLADGNNLVKVPSLERQDELGDMAKALQGIKEYTLQQKRVQTAGERFKTRSDEERKAAMHRFADDFEGRTDSIVRSLASCVSQMQSTVAQISSSSGRASEISRTVAVAATQTDANVQMVSAAADDIFVSASEILQKTNVVTTCAEKTTHEAENTAKEVKNLTEMALSIGAVVDTIKDMAEQTNLLALNATIEAAHAGDTGKSVAIIAKQIKNIANETTKKTEDMSARVSRIQAAIDSSAQAMEKLINSSMSINEAAISVNSSVECQKTAAGEIGHSILQASTGAQQIAQNIAAVQENAVQASVSSKTILQAAQQLADLSNDLRDQMSSLLNELRGVSPQNHDEYKIAAE